MCLLSHNILHFLKDFDFVWNTAETREGSRGNATPLPVWRPAFVYLASSIFASPVSFARARDLEFHVVILLLFVRTPFCDFSVYPSPTPRSSGKSSSTFSTTFLPRLCRDISRSCHRWPWNDQLSGQLTVKRSLPGFSFSSATF